MPTIAVTEAITTIAEAEDKFGLSRSESADFLQNGTINYLRLVLVIGLV